MAATVNTYGMMISVADSVYGHEILTGTIQGQPAARLVQVSEPLMLGMRRLNNPACVGRRTLGTWFGADAMEHATAARKAEEARLYAQKQISGVWGAFTPTGATGFVR